MSDQLFSQWVDDYSEDLLVWAKLKVGSEDLAQDLVQETFISAYQKLDGFRAESNPKTWLSSILNHKIIDYFRSAEYRKKVQMPQSVAQDSDLEDHFFKPDGHWENKAFGLPWENEENLLDRSDFRALFENCLADLPQLWRDVIAARYFGGQKGAEISKEFNISTSNYWQISHRAKLLLKKCIEVYWQS